MYYLKLWSKPLTEEMITSWTAILDDVVKVGIVAIPTVLYGEYSWEFKTINSLMLVSFIYGILCMSKFMRQYKSTSFARRK